jgi:hypothetical protein
MRIRSSRCKRHDFRPTDATRRAGHENPYSYQQVVTDSRLPAAPSERRSGARASALSRLFINCLRRGVGTRLRARARAQVDGSRGEITDLLPRAESFGRDNRVDSDNADETSRLIN